MSARRHALIRAALLALGGVPFASSASASPPVDPGALAHCASMTVADERLACYDSLSRPKSVAAPAAPAASAAPASTGAKPPPGTGKTPPATSTAAAPAAAAATAGSTAAVAPAAAAATAGSAAAAAPAAAPDAKNFGLMRHPAPTEQGPDRIQAKVARVDTDRLGKVRVLLDNGQAWVFTAPEALLRVGEPVTIKRGAIESFLLTTASHHTYRAQRAQ
jgi:hypothetical protein